MTPLDRARIRRDALIGQLRALDALRDALLEAVSRFRRHVVAELRTLEAEHGLQAYATGAPDAVSVAELQRAVAGQGDMG